MFDAGISPEHAQSVVAGCGLAVAALAGLGQHAWTLIELATAVEAEHRPAAMAAARQQARDHGCAAMLDHTLEACRYLVRSADCLQEYPELDAVLTAVDGSVAAAVMAGRIDPEIAAVLTGPQRALASLLTATATATATAAPTALAVG